MPTGALCLSIMERSINVHYYYHYYYYYYFYIYIIILGWLPSRTMAMTFLVFYPLGRLGRWPPCTRRSASPLTWRRLAGALRSRSTVSICRTRPLASWMRTQWCLPSWRVVCVFIWLSCYGPIRPTSETRLRWVTDGLYDLSADPPCSKWKNKNQWGLYCSKVSQACFRHNNNND